MTEKYQLKNTQTGKTVELSIDDILIMINEDRTEEWENYDKTDWKEGLEQFTDYIIINS